MQVIRRDKTKNPLDRMASSVSKGSGRPGGRRAAESRNISRFCYIFLELIPPVFADPVRSGMS